MTTLNLDDVKQLSVEQYAKVHEKAVSHVLRLIGDKPLRDQYKRDHEPIWGFMEALMVFVFLAAAIVSTTHILNFIGSEAARSFNQNGHVPDTISLSARGFNTANQFGYVILAEFAMLLFGTGAINERRKFIKVMFALLALGSTAFVIIANLESGIDWYIAILPPAFTIGLSPFLDRQLIKTLKRRRAVTVAHQEALGKWEVLTDKPEQHTQFLPTLRLMVWEKLVSLKSNAEYKRAPAQFRQRVADREILKAQIFSAPLLKAAALEVVETDAPLVIHNPKVPDLVN